MPGRGFSGGFLAVAVAVGVSMLGGSTSADASRRDNSVPEARPVGEPISCINMRSVNNTIVHDDYTIDFKMAGGRTYRNTLRSRCSTLDPDEPIQYELHGSQLCSVDIIRPLERFGNGLEPVGFCVLGKFQQVELVDDPRERSRRNRG